MTRVAASRSRHQRCAGRRMVKGFGGLPRSARALGLLLEIAPRKVNSDRITPDVMRLYGRRGYVATAAPDGHDQFDLMAEVCGARWVGQRVLRRHHRAGGFH